jgi:50S ribosomal subunit-associated GTPase HflX
MSVKLEVSIGEALDKLTILDIKKDKIVDVNNKADVVKEYNYLYNELKDFISRNNYYYCILKRVNLEIWDLMDIIRTPIDREKYYLLCDITVNLNDSRFLVKKKINSLSESNLKEQKGYKKRCINIAYNTDNNIFILFLGAIRYYSLFYDEVFVYMKNVQNYNNEFIDPYINILPFTTTESIKNDNYDYVIVSMAGENMDTITNTNINIDKKITHTYFINKKKYDEISNNTYKETTDTLINEIYKKLDLEPTISLEF